MEISRELIIEQIEAEIERHAKELDRYENGTHSHSHAMGSLMGLTAALMIVKGARVCM